MHPDISARVDHDELLVAFTVDLVRVHPRASHLGGVPSLTEVVRRFLPRVVAGCNNWRTARSDCAALVRGHDLPRRERLQLRPRPRGQRRPVGLLYSSVLEPANTSSYDTQKPSSNVNTSRAMERLVSSRVSAPLRLLCGSAA